MSAPSMHGHPVRTVTAAFALLLGLAAQCAQAHTTCTSNDQCLDAILAAGGAGRQVESIGWMHELLGHRTATGSITVSGLRLPQRPPETLGVGNVDEALTQLVRNADTAFGDLPEYHRAVALAYLKAGRLDDARRLLEDALAADPVYAPYWMDLGIVYAREGRHERAVSALVVADAWAGDQAALRQAYRQAAGETPEAGLGADYAAALKRIAANEAAQAQLDTVLTPVSFKGAAGDPSRKSAFVRLASCDKPQYPKAALRYEETGTVTVNFLVDSGGRVQAVRKVKSSGHPQLDDAALFWLAVCPFHPATVDGKPVATWQAVQYVWTLE